MHPLARYHYVAVLASDVVVFTMTLDMAIFCFIRQRQQLLRPSICEINDYLPDFQAWNPAFHGVTGVHCIASTKF